MSVYLGEWAAFLTMERVIAQGAYLNLALAEVFLEHNLDSPARAMATALVRTTLENCISVDFALETVTNTRRCGRAIHNILCLGAARMLYMHAEDATVVNASVELCKRAGKGAQSGYVNGVLRKLSQTKDDIPWPKREADPHQYLSINYSWPLWAVKQAEKQLGFEGTEKMMQSAGKDYVTIRVNRQKTTIDSLQQALLSAGGKVETVPIAPYMLRIRGLADITGLSEYRLGHFSLQGEASMLFSEQIPQICKKVMDLCAAPGGKTCAMAERLPEAQVFAYDIHPHRVELIDKQVQRLGLNNVVTGNWDARTLMTEHAGTACAVLVDAPCSGLGTAGKRPDVKLNRDFADVLSLSRLQGEILDTASLYVKPGGVLAYGTCTFMRQENRDVVEKFLKRHPDFALVPLLLPTLFANQGQSGMLQLWPHIHGTDGFFMARMQRID